MAEHQRRVAAMDPPHITEFASERYFEKLNQLQAEYAESSTATTATAFHASSMSRFILPLRDSKPAEFDAVKPADSKRDKSRFFSIRHKVSLLHSKSDAAEATSIAHSRASTESTRKRFVLFSSACQLQQGY